jgi:hypothetical protein
MTVMTRALRSWLGAAGARLALVLRLCAAIFVCLPTGVARAEGDTSCRESCEAERKKIERKLEECLREVEPRPADRAAKMKLLCRQRYALPRCDGLPACKREAQPKARAPGMTIGALVFSAVRRGPALAQPRFVAGGELNLRIDVEVLSKPKANRVWLQLNLRMLALVKKGKPREVTRWDGYAEEQRVIDPAERGLPLRFTLHGGAQLPADLDPGSYEIEATVLEKACGFQASTKAAFQVTRARAPR